MAKIELDCVRELIKKHYGLDLYRGNTDKLSTALVNRMNVCNAGSVEGYLQILQTQETEFLQLIQHLTVNETYFMREAGHLKTMACHIVPQLLRGRGKLPVIRLLSAGCSTGEEAYSMAFALMEVPGAGVSWDFEIIGVDVDVSAVANARKGIYSRYSFRSCPSAVWEQHFTKEGAAHWCIKDDIKRKVRFEVLNLFAPAYPEYMQQLDVIFFRNVAIYFAQGQHEIMFRRLISLLNTEGAIFLSSAEMPRYHDDAVSLKRYKDVFYFAKRAAGVSEEKAAHSPKTHSRLRSETLKAPIVFPPRIKHKITAERKVPRFESLVPAVADNNNLESLLSDSLEKIRYKKYDQALQLLDQIIRTQEETPAGRQPAASDYFSKAISKAYLLKANVLLNQEDFPAVIKVCKQALAIEEFSLEAYLLIGQAEKLVSNYTEAKQHFKQVIYLQSDCWLAHFWLAEVYHKLQEAELAKREYLIAGKLLSQGRFQQHGLSVFAIPFQETEFIQLCNHNVQRLSAD